MVNEHRAREREHGGSARKPGTAAAAGHSERVGDGRTTERRGGGGRPHGGGRRQHHHSTDRRTDKLRERVRTQQPAQKPRTGEPRTGPRRRRPTPRGRTAAHNQGPAAEAADRTGADDGSTTPTDGRTSSWERVRTQQPTQGPRAEKGEGEPSKGRGGGGRHCTGADRRQHHHSHRPTHGQAQGSKCVRSSRAEQGTETRKRARRRGAHNGGGPSTRQQTRTRREENGGHDDDGSTTGGEGDVHETPHDERTGTGARTSGRAVPNRGRRARSRHQGRESTWTRDLKTGIPEANERTPKGGRSAGSTGANRARKHRARGGHPHQGVLPRTLGPTDERKLQKGGCARSGRSKPERDGAIPEAKRATLK